MNIPNDDHDSQFELRATVEAELRMAEESRPEEAFSLPVEEWLFDPVDVEREEVELRSLLGAIDEVDRNSRHEGHGTGEHEVR